MPLVHVQMAEGRTDDQKRALMEAITDAVEEHLGASRASVRVWITEFPATDFMAGGETLAERRAVTPPGSG
jgi:4-oxalocrotonate tautomerase